MKYMKERDKEIAKMYLDGALIKTIAYKFSITSSSVSHIVRSHKLPRRYKTLPVKHQVTVYLESETVIWFKNRYGKQFSKQLRKILTDYVTVRKAMYANPTCGRTPEKSNHELLRERY